MGWLLLVLLVVLATAPFLVEQRRAPPEPAKDLRRLSQGRTCIRWTGPSRGPVVLAVHGLTTPSPVYNALAAGLAGAGYRVLSYDLYGRGQSDSVPGRQDPAFFIQQIDDLLADQGIAGDVLLMGYSMGGGIVTEYAAARPERTRRLILLAPTGMAYDAGPWERLTLVPLIGDWLSLAVDPWLLRRAIRASGAAPEIAALQLAETHRRGFFPAVLSSRRHMLGHSCKEAHRALAAEGIPVLALWADQDTVIPLRGLGTLAQWNRHAKQEVIEGAGHGLPHTHPDAVARTIVGVIGEG